MNTAFSELNSYRIYTDLLFIVSLGKELPKMNPV